MNKPLERCPKCNGELEYKDLDFDHGHIYQDCYCLDCKAEFVEVYQYKEYREYEK